MFGAVKGKYKGKQGRKGQVKALWPLKSQGLLVILSDDKDEGKKCRVYAAPFAVWLFERDGEAPEDVDTMVEPDISVVCDGDKLDRHGCKGAPDLVIEILSPSTRRHDRLIKLGLYQRAGVREYWIVDPENKAVQAFLQDGGGSLKIHEDYGREDVAKVNVLSGCFIELNRVFPA